MDNVSAAKILIRCLDLTSLGEQDTDAKIIKLCQKAVTPYGNVASVCVYPKFIPTAQKNLKDGKIKIATVINFPKGDETDLRKLNTDIGYALQLGAQEIDMVFPYEKFLKGELSFCEDFLGVVTNACNKNGLSKIILETGKLQSAAKIEAACQMCLKYKINFLKTSTGKTDISATPEAANCILETIKAGGNLNVGFKASGGIKTTDDAKQYLVLASAIMGYKWVSPKNFRIGASSLIDDLIATIERGY